jgi:hypothetical protein
MRKTLWIMLAVLLVAIGAPSAHADSLPATFTCGICVGGTPTAPDVLFPAPVVDVTWNDLLFHLDLPSSDLPTDSYEWNGHTTSGGGEIFLQDFTIHDLTNGTEVNMVHDTGKGVNAPLDSGTLSFAAVAAPEPSSIALMLAGIGSLLVLRKRIGRRLPQAS